MHQAVVDLLLVLSRSFSQHYIKKAFLFFPLLQNSNGSTEELSNSPSVTPYIVVGLPHRWGGGVRLGVKKTRETLKPQEARPEPTPSRVRYQTQRSSDRGTYITTLGPQTSAFSRSSSFSPNERSGNVGPRRMSWKLEWVVKSGPETP